MLPFTVAALPGIAAGTLAGDLVGDAVLLAVLALVMLAAARGIWRRAGREEPDPGRDADACPPLRLPRGRLRAGEPASANGDAAG